MRQRLGVEVLDMGVVRDDPAQARYNGVKNLELRAGIRNLFDRDPPYSNAGGNTSFQGNYNASYGDPQGRFYYAGLNYKFF